MPWVQDESQESEEPADGNEDAVKEAEAHADGYADPVKAVNELRFSARASVWTASRMADHPCGCLSGCCAFVWMLILISVLSGEMAFVPEGGKDWEVLSSKEVEDLDARRLAERAVDCLHPVDGICRPADPRSQADYGAHYLTFLFETRDGSGIFTPQNLRRICQVEQTFSTQRKYPDFCPLTAANAALAATGHTSFSSSDCDVQYMSIVIYFYTNASMDPSLCEEIPAAQVEVASVALHEKVLTEDGRFTHGAYVGSDALTDRAHGRNGGTRRARTMLALGAPLKGFEDAPYTDPDLIAEYEPFWVDYEKGLLDHFDKEHAFFRSALWDDWELGDMDVLFFAWPMDSREVQRVVNSDMGFALFSIVFVFCYLAFHTRSGFVAAISIMQIVGSIPLSFFFYRFFFQITFFQQLHGLLIFIILGIGADDIFVFSDAWYQSEGLINQNGWWKDILVTKGPIAARLAIAIQRTATTVLNTSVTTGSAFFATAISPLMPMKTMGYFGCLLVFMNYLLAISVTPATFAVMETYNIACCGCLSRCRRIRFAMVLPSPEDKYPSAGEPEAVRGESGAVTKTSSAASTATAGKAFSEGARSSRTSVTGAAKDLTPWILRRCFIPAFGNFWVSLVSMLCCICWGSLNVYFTSLLDTPAEPFTFWEDGHMAPRFTQRSRNDYATGDESSYNLMSVIIGIDGVDREPADGRRVDYWHPHLFYGVVDWDEHFDLSTAEAQDYVRQLCQDLRAQECNFEGCAPSYTLLQQSSSAFTCFIEEFDAWAGGGRFTGAEFLDQLMLFRNSTYPQESVGWHHSWEQIIGFVDGDLKFVQLVGLMTLKMLKGRAIKTDVQNVADQFVEDHVAVAPPTAKSLIQTVQLDWTWTVSERSLVEGMFQGFAICFPVAFFVLLGATQNYIVSLGAVITIGFVVASVLGYCQAVEGWSLGISESIAGIIVIGLAVDYTIHLGHFYLEGGHEGLELRAERWEYAVRTMGVTMIAGAVTTFGAGIVMQFCQILFFTQMSTLISVTIAYSVMYTLCCFMAALRVLGPERQQGDISWMVDLCFAKLASMFARNEEKH